MEKVNPHKRQSWIVKSDDEEVFTTLENKNFYELQVWALSTYPAYFRADRLIASPLEEWTA